jgi:hypothetical protein
MDEIVGKILDMVCIFFSRLFFPPLPFASFLLSLSFGPWRIELTDHRNPIRDAEPFVP